MLEIVEQLVMSNEVGTDRDRVLKSRPHRNADRDDQYFRTFVAPVAQRTLLLRIDAEHCRPAKSSAELVHEIRQLEAPWLTRCPARRPEARVNTDSGAIILTRIWAAARSCRAITASRAAIPLPTTTTRRGSI